jgi:hypothetical protein
MRFAQILQESLSLKDTLKVNNNVLLTAYDLAVRIVFVLLSSVIFGNIINIREPGKYHGR